MDIVGISAYYHDSAVALIRDGEIIAAAQEERFSRKKHDERFPGLALAWCLKAGGTTLDQVGLVAFYDKPWLKFERILETYLGSAPGGLTSFLAAIPMWLRDKLNLKKSLKRNLALASGIDEASVPPLIFTEHHQAHAASAFYPSPFQRSAILCMDGVGEWATTTLWLGQDAQLTPLWQIDFPHSLGLLFSAFTYYTGFKVNSGEYKVMGLAPYGEPKYAEQILNEIIDLKPDGTFRLNLDYFNYTTGLTMTSDRFHSLFGGAPRQPETPLTQREMDLAASIQKVTEEVVLRLVRTAHRETGAQFLCLAGGVALNCVANGRVVSEGPFRDIWIQPAAGDAGGAVGTALAAWHLFKRAPRVPHETDAMKGTYLGPEFSDAVTKQALEALGARYEELDDDELFDRVAHALANGAVIGWFQGRMEFGPRALGNRSILGDPRGPQMQSVLNLKIKYRESFRPFAPAVLAERAAEYFDLDRPSRYMLLVAPVSDLQRLPEQGQSSELSGIEKLKIPRSTIPAVTHVDYSARIQSVHSDTNPRFHELIHRFDQKTGCPLLVNTSFNVRGEPIVATPTDAYRCFMRTDMDYLVVGNIFLSKSEQSAPSAEDRSWQYEYALD